MSQEEYISSLKQAEVRSEDKKELLSVVESDSLRLKTASYETCQLGNKLCLRYENLGDDSSLKLVVYADAAYGNLPDGGSQGGYFISPVGQNRKCSLLSWQS